MSHRSYIKRQKEDWAGVTDSKERKKLQNNLNQRAWRQRKLKQGAKESATEGTSKGVTDAGERTINEQLTAATAR
ncbi:hypothetical protein N7475_000403 [Penicillium sp. IBT 31633x]|nr:hypothetical protein N7475_000403 [Penicillium sp. IBT 31633x]